MLNDIEIRLSLLVEPGTMIAIKPERAVMIHPFDWIAVTYGKDYHARLDAVARWISLDAGQKAARAVAILNAQSERTP